MYCAYRLERLHSTLPHLDNIHLEVESIILHEAQPSAVLVSLEPAVFSCACMQGTPASKTSAVWSLRPHHKSCNV